ncbi:MAG TPA: D-sedoheptulose 7-phosphate isomerase [Candidatus Aphodousia faecavium]|uniref:Phosphoheptose isomerase n=1 Tax=Parasutterella secunda TaxID=626947 RepID=A0ABS2GSA6_9BURK|nr:D-sedoheptulose 7-phosphate isomerase [Parasutterella secunda]MBM6928725.1 D-sedoheptulose 7-phosphate isomerase [Parasutterella secunda]HIT95862.1 D-sedoheptulose 7-phosphate isomerase [Candidatus Aphodousia faecavium]
MAKEHVKAALVEARQALDALIAADQTQEAIVQASELMAETIRRGGKILSCGNGGSLCDSMHFAEEMTGRFRSDRPGYAAIAIADASHMSCVGNDYGYRAVFSRYVEAVGRPGDVLLAITTSGTSANVIDAVEAAHKNGMKVVGLTGKFDSPLAQKADVAIVTPAGRWADRVQELHIKCIHILIELVERQLAPENYK